MFTDIKDIYIKKDSFINILKDENLKIDIDEVESPAKFKIESAVSTERVTIYYYMEKFKPSIIRLVEDLSYAIRTPLPISDTTTLPNGTDYKLYKNFIKDAIEKNASLSGTLLKVFDVFLNELHPIERPIANSREIITRESFDSNESYFAEVNKVLKDNKDIIEEVQIYASISKYSDSLEVATDNLICAHEIMGYLVPYDYKNLDSIASRCLAEVSKRNIVSAGLIKTVIADYLSLLTNGSNCSDWLADTVIYHLFLQDALELTRELVKVGGINNEGSISKVTI